MDSITRNGLSALVIVIVNLMDPLPAHGESQKNATMPLPHTYESDSSIDSQGVRCRSQFWRPLGSMVLPGLGQYMCGQTSSGLVYTGVALLGIGLNLHYSAKVSEEEKKEASGDLVPDSDQFNLRNATLGALIVQGAGGMSAYHAFRTAVRQEIVEGRYEFLTHEETSGEILLAPFHFSYLARASTWMPLGILATLAALSPQISEEKLEYVSPNAHQSAFNLGVSYNAGTHEEAIFRGWLMPLFREKFVGNFWANANTSLLFAAAHLGTNKLPLPQLILGYYLGNVVQKDQWRLGEAVFIHTWWDVIALFASHFREKDKSKAVSIRLPPLTLEF